MAQQGPEILIILGDPEYGWWGKGLCEHLRGKGRQVVELAADADQATEQNIDEYLPVYQNGCVRKLVVFFGHGREFACWDEFGDKWITNDSYEDLTKDIHLFMFACATASPCSDRRLDPDQCSDYGLGRESVERGFCYSWYGYIDDIFLSGRKPDSDEIYCKIKVALWAYVDALVDKHTVTEAEDALVKALLKVRDELTALRPTLDPESRQNLDKIIAETIDDWLLKGRLYKTRDNLRIDADNRDPIEIIPNGHSELFKPTGTMLVFLTQWWQQHLAAGVRFTAPDCSLKISDGRVISIPSDATTVSVTFTDPGSYDWSLSSNTTLRDAMGRSTGTVKSGTVASGLMKIAPKQIRRVATPPSCNARAALIQSDFGKLGSLELVLWEGTFLRHYYRENDSSNLSWRQGVLFGENITSAPALIQSNFGTPHGNFEVVAREGSCLRHYYRDNTAPGQPWFQGVLFGENVASAPALIHSSFGAPHGNFEVVVREGSCLRHYYRDNGAPGQPWRQGVLFGDNVDSEPTLIESNYGAPHGNFEVVVREGAYLRHYYRDNAASGQPWRQGVLFGDDCWSAPSLIQSSYGAPHGNFEVLVGTGLRSQHYRRDNSAANPVWWAGHVLGRTVVSPAALVQGKLGQAGNNFEAVAIECEAGQYIAYHFWRDNSKSADGSWTRGQAIGTVGEWVVTVTALAKADPPPGPVVKPKTGPVVKPKTGPKK